MTLRILCLVEEVESTLWLGASGLRPQLPQKSNLVSQTLVRPGTFQPLLKGEKGKRWHKGKVAESFESYVDVTAVSNFHSRVVTSTSCATRLRFFFR